MMNPWVSMAISVVIAYLLGSLNFSIIISKLLLKKDIRNYGSGNAGSTNSLRVMGGKKTILVLLGDILKGFVAMIICMLICDDEMMGVAKVASGIACVLGHSFPVYFGFRGGKGVLTTAAVGAFVDWRVCLTALGIFFIVVMISKFVSLGSVITMCSLPLLFYLYGGKNVVPNIWFGSLIAVLVVFLHRGNIKRLIAGTENKLSFKKK
ncbi:MAG: glycerol-3-phosphate 1-O-acyltransferase PlsY [Oscillospiraceae bacterium]|nr:glycerol-3-phosphate 1-O-acyltransferase PlsY [Oscillospiraceae bacterium]